MYEYVHIHNYLMYPVINYIFTIKYKILNKKPF